MAPLVARGGSLSLVVDLVAGVFLLAGAGLWLKRRRATTPRARRLAVVDEGQSQEPTHFAGQRGPYRVESVLGRGGTAVVYRCGTEEGHTVAVKMLLRDGTSLRDRFDREARICQSLDHPAIVKVIDFGNVARVHASHPFLVLEFVTGVTLRQRMAQGQTPWPLAMTWLCETLEGLQVAHQRHIFHRDIKPDNLMITQDDHVKIVDFGFAREAGFTMTGSATNIGTPRYMSPEHLDAKTVSGASDLYSLGIVFYEVMSGAYPFVEAPGDTPYDTLARRLTAEPVDIGKHNPNLPRAVADVVMAMLSMRRDQRQVDPETARAVLQAAQGTV